MVGESASRQQRPERPIRNQFPTFHARRGTVYLPSQLHTKELNSLSRPKYNNNKMYSMNDQILNLRLVEEVEKHEELYNYHLPAYSRKDATYKAWEEVAAKINMTAADAKDRWRNLRAVFIRKMKCPPSPSGSQKHSRAYYLADAMQFCVPYIKALARPSPKLTSFTPKQEITDDVLEISLGCDDSVDPLTGDSPETVQFSQEAQPQSCSPQASPGWYAPLQESLAESTSSQTHKSVMCESDADVNDHFNSKKARLGAATSTVASRSYGVDKKIAIEMFLLSLLPELEEFDDSQIKKFKRKIFSVIDEISASPQL